MNVIKEGESFTVGNMRIKTFPVTHSIPDAMGIAVETKHGDVVITVTSNSCTRKVKW